MRQSFEERTGDFKPLAESRLPARVDVPLLASPARHGESLAEVLGVFKLCVYQDFPSFVGIAVFPVYADPRQPRVERVCVLKPEGNDDGARPVDKSPKLPQLRGREPLGEAARLVKALLCNQAPPTYRCK